MSERKPEIYCFVNSGRGSDWQHVIALAEDGHCLASHISSSESFARHDIGITSDWKHEKYREHYPDGYELVWVERPESDERVDAAYALNQQLAAAATQEDARDTHSIIEPEEKS